MDAGGVDRHRHLVDVEVAGFHPVDAAVGDFDEEDGVGEAVEDVGVSEKRIRTSPRGLRSGDYDITRLCVAIGIFVSRTTETFKNIVVQFAVVGAIPRFVEAVLVMYRFLFEIRQKENTPTVQRFAAGVGDEGWRV